MVEREILREWIYKEHETIRTVSRHVVPREDKLFSLDLRELYPEFKNRRIMGTSLYTYCHRELNVKVLLLFQDVVIINVEPYDRATFEKVYGISIEEARELLDEGYIEVRLRAPYGEYVGKYDIDELLYAAADKYGGYVPHADRHWFIAVSETARERCNILYRLYYESILKDPTVRSLVISSLSRIREAFKMLLEKPYLNYDLYDLYRGSSLNTISRLYYITIRDLLALNYGSSVYDEIRKLLREKLASTNLSYILEQAEKLRALALVTVWPWTASLAGFHIYPTRYFEKKLTVEEAAKLLKEVATGRVRLGFDKIFVTFSENVLHIDPKHVEIDEIKRLRRDSTRRELDRIVQYLESEIRKKIVEPLIKEEIKPSDVWEACRELRELLLQEVPRVVKNCAEAVEAYSRRRDYMLYCSVGISVMSSIGELANLIIPFPHSVLLGSIIPGIATPIIAGLILPKRTYTWLISRIKKCPILSSIVNIIEGKR